jgi:hypothetical protein
MPLLEKMESVKVIAPRYAGYSLLRQLEDHFAIPFGIAIDEISRIIRLPRRAEICLQIRPFAANINFTTESVPGILENDTDEQILARGT